MLQIPPKLLKTDGKGLCPTIYEPFLATSYRFHAINVKLQEENDMKIAAILNTSTNLVYFTYPYGKEPTENI